MKMQLISEAQAADKRYRAALESARQDRVAAIKAAMDAGVPRKELADALGVEREHLYKIIRSV